MIVSPRKKYYRDLTRRKKHLEPFRCDHQTRYLSGSLFESAVGTRPWECGNGESFRTLLTAKFRTTLAFGAFSSRNVKIFINYRFGEVSESEDDFTMNHEFLQ